MMIVRLLRVLGKKKARLAMKLKQPTALKSSLALPADIRRNVFDPKWDPTKQGNEQEAGITGGGEAMPESCGETSAPKTKEFETKPAAEEPPTPLVKKKYSNVAYTDKRVIPKFGRTCLTDDPQEIQVWQSEWVPRFEAVRAKFSALSQDPMPKTKGEWAAVLELTEIPDWAELDKMPTWPLMAKLEAKKITPLVKAERKYDNVPYVCPMGCGLPITGAADIPHIKFCVGLPGHAQLCNCGELCGRSVMLSHRDYGHGRKFRNNMLMPKEFFVMAAWYFFLTTMYPTGQYPKNPGQQE